MVKIQKIPTVNKNESLSFMPSPAVARYWKRVEKGKKNFKKKIAKIRGKYGKKR